MRADVAIIGCGPIGALLGNLLGRRGLSVIIAEKQQQPYHLPRAIHFDGEVMRCVQSAGLAEAVLPHTHVGKGMLFQDKNGNTIVDWSRDQVPGPMGWYESYRFYQPGLEAELRKGLGRFEDVKLLTGAEVTGINEDQASVTLTLSDGQQITSSYTIGCDGSRSRTRDHLSAGLNDLGFQERWLVVDLLLTRPRDDLGDHSVQFCDPENPATYVRGSGDRRRWELRLRDGDPDEFSKKLVWKRLSRWITPADAELERSAVYVFRSQIAESWRRGRCLLAGDAAHQMPPFMGQGMCAGVRDAANLAWKLAAVVRGADSNLLDTYQSEREANVRAFIEKSVSLGRLINQTAAGEVPRGQMKSIWPDLGPGLGPRDGVGGVLTPQVKLSDGTLADDATKNGFYLLAKERLRSDLPIIHGAADWLSDRGINAAVVRPDGYCLAGLDNESDVQKLSELVPELDNIRENLPAAS